MHTFIGQTSFERTLEVLRELESTKKCISLMAGEAPGAGGTGEGREASQGRDRTEGATRGGRPV